MKNKKTYLTLGLSLFVFSILTYEVKKNNLLGNLNSESKEAVVRSTASIKNQTHLIKEQSIHHVMTDDIEISKISEEGLRKLNNYNSMKQKVLLTEQEKQEKLTLLTDQELLLELKSFLLNSQFSTSDNQVMNQKNQALDLLLESSRLPTGEQATSLLKDIIEDNQIENTKLSMEGRQFFADMKAEILYELTSQSVDAETAQIEQLIRDPYTAKIWKNVQYAQQQNRLESLESN